MHILDFWMELAQCRSRNVYKEVRVENEEGDCGEILHVREYPDFVCVAATLERPPVGWDEAALCVCEGGQFEIVDVEASSGVLALLKKAWPKKTTTELQEIWEELIKEGKGT